MTDRIAGYEMVVDLADPLRDAGVEIIDAPVEVDEDGVVCTLELRLPDVESVELELGTPADPTQDLSEALHKRKVAEEELAQLEGELSQTEQRVEELEKALDERAARVTELEEENGALEDEVETLEQHVEIAQSDESEWREEAALLEERLDTARGAITVLREDRDRLLDANEQLSDRVDELQERLEIPDVPDHVADAIDDVLLRGMSQEEALRHYEERHVEIEFENRECGACERLCEHRIEIDHHLEDVQTECSKCNAEDEALPPEDTPEPPVQEDSPEPTEEPHQEDGQEGTREPPKETEADQDDDRRKYLNNNELRAEIAYAVGEDPTRFDGDSDATALQKETLARVAERLQPEDSDLEVGAMEMSELYRSVGEWVGVEHSGSQQNWGLNRDHLKAIHEAIDAEDPENVPDVQEERADQDDGDADGQEDVDEQDDGDLSPGEEATLAALRELGEATNNELGQTIDDYQPGSISTYLRGLRDHGLVETEPHPDDGRKMLYRPVVDEGDEDEEPEREWSRCARCDTSFDDTLEYAIHRTEQHDAPQSELGNLEPGEFESIVEDADSFPEVVDAVGFSSERVLRMLGIYGFEDFVADIDGMTSAGPAPDPEVEQVLEEIEDDADETDDAPDVDAGVDREESEAARIAREHDLDRHDIADAIADAQAPLHVHRELGIDREVAADLCRALDVYDEQSGTVKVATSEVLELVCKHVPPAAVADGGDA